MAIAPQLLRRPAAGRLRGPTRSRSTRRRTRPFAYYYPPTPDGSRAGIYYANGYDLPSRKYTKLATTTYHEAAPGHHFQITLETENPHLNAFRRLGARIVGGAYVEGWGLYSERLADEMGLFRDEAERFGMLDAQAWRAARLVVDTGLHALRWPRQRSIDFLPDDRPVRDRRGHRDRPLHLLAGPGADLHDRPARDRAAAGRARRPATARRSTCGRSTTPSSATARCRWPRSRASSRTGWRPRSEPGRALAAARSAAAAAGSCHLRTDSQRERQPHGGHATAVARARVRPDRSAAKAADPRRVADYRVWAAR